MVEEVLFPAGLRAEQENLLHHAIQIRAMVLDKNVEVTLLLFNKAGEILPRAFDDLEVAVCLKLPDEVDHLSHYEPDLMPIVVKLCKPRRHQY